MSWYLGVLKNYAGFNGRACRTEYWMFILINMAIALALGFVDLGLGLTTAAGYGLFSGLYSLLVLVPSTAVAVRRLHDTNRSGLWFVLVFVPLIGTIALLVLLAGEGTAGPNQYGPN